MSAIIKPFLFVTDRAKKQENVTPLLFAAYAPSDDVPDPPEPEPEPEEIIFIRRKRRAAARNLDAQLKAQGILL